jgi:hypothetical protein
VYGVSRGAGDSVPWGVLMCPVCACAVKVHLTSGWKSRPRRKSTPSVAIWRGREVTPGLEAQRQKASKGGRASLQAAT